MYGSFSSRYSPVTSLFDSNQMGPSSSFPSFNSIESMDIMQTPGLGYVPTLLGPLGDYIQPQSMSRMNTTTITPMSAHSPPRLCPAAHPSLSDQRQMTFCSPGTPGLEIGPPSGTASPRIEQQQAAPAPIQTNSAGSVKPPVQTQSNPITNKSGQFVLDFKITSPSSAACSKRKPLFTVLQLQTPSRPLNPPKSEMKTTPSPEQLLSSSKITREMLSPTPAILRPPAVCLLRLLASIIYFTNWIRYLGNSS